MTTQVTKCFNSSKPYEVIDLGQAAIELSQLSWETNRYVKDRTGQDYGANFYADLMKKGEVMVNDVSYHLGQIQ